MESSRGMAAAGGETVTPTRETETLSVRETHRSRIEVVRPGHRLQRPIQPLLVHPVQLRHPIIALIRLNRRRRTLALDEVVKVVGRAEPAPAEDTVHVGRRGVGRDDRVEAGGEEVAEWLVPYRAGGVGRGAAEDGG
jgi:hypothetical protein